MGETRRRVDNVAAREQAARGWLAGDPSAGGGAVRVHGHPAGLMTTDDSGYEVNGAAVVFFCGRCARCVAAPDG